MAPKREVTITLKAVDEASKVITNVANNLLPSLAKRIAGLGVSWLSVGAVEGVFRKSLEQAAESDAAAKRLTQTLSAQGQQAGKLVPQLLEEADAYSRVLTATHEAVTGAQQILISVGGLTGGALTRATQATLDLSAGLGIDLSEAALRVAKAANGSVREFTRLGVTFKDGATNAEKLETVLQFVQNRFGGMAANELKTITGATANLQKAWGELEETMGKRIIVNTNAIDAINGITQAMQDLNDEANQSRGKLGFWKSLVLEISAPLTAPGIIATDLALAGEKAKAVKDNVDQEALENPMLGFADATAAAAAKLQQAKDEAEALEERQKHLADEAKRYREEYEKLTGKTFPGLPEIKVEGVDWSKIDRDWAKSIYDSAKKADDEAKKLKETLESFNERTEVQTFAPVKREPRQLPEIATEIPAFPGPAEKSTIERLGAEGVEIERTITIVNALRDAELQLNAPVKTIAESWQQVNAALQTLASALPKDDEPLQKQVKTLMEIARISEENATKAHDVGGTTEIDAQAQAWAALKKVVESISYLTPEQELQFEALVQAQNRIGIQAQRTSDIQQTGIALATQGATQLGDAMVDAAFGADVAWGEILRSILKSLIKAVVEALIIRAITEAILAASEGTVVRPESVSSKDSVGSGSTFAATIDQASSGMVVPQRYAAGGLAGAESAAYLAPGGRIVSSPRKSTALMRAIFKPRGTDTVPAMLTPGEAVLPVKLVQRIMAGQASLVGGRTDDARTNGAQSLFSGRFAVVPSTPHPIAVAIAGAANSPSAPAMEAGGTVYASDGVILDHRVPPSLALDSRAMRVPSPIAIEHPSLEAPTSPAPSKYPPIGSSGVIHADVSSSDSIGPQAHIPPSLVTVQLGPQVMARLFIDHQRGLIEAIEDWQSRRD